ncbi:MAG TPA: hypothetical protein VHE12_00785 [bacterium]|nr:hypothetical protein [bacterium]
MKKRTNKIQGAVLAMVLGAFSAARADHGTLSSNERSPWINDALSRLVEEGWAPSPTKPIAQLSNLEAAEMTAHTGEILVAQLPPPGDDLTLPPPMDPNFGLPGALPPPPAAAGLPSFPSPAASKSAGQLVEEFKKELKAMGADLPRIEDRIFALEHRNESLGAQQQVLLKRTGTEGTGFSRGYFNSYRGFGINAPYTTTQYNYDLFMDMSLHSIPVPTVLFEATIRFWRTLGMFYADPISPKTDLRWLSLSDYNEYFTVNAGDFWQHYSPLVLWNYDVPVYTLLEPSSFYRNRKDVEELAMMDHGPDFRVRGFRASTDLMGSNDPFFSDLKAEAMVSPIKNATEFSFGDYMAGSQIALVLLDKNVELKGDGLLIWDDPGTINDSNNLYTPDFPLTFPKQYHVGSLSAKVKVPFDADVNVTGEGEYGSSRYVDDANNPDRAFQDWAYWMSGSLNIAGFHLSAKYMDIGPYFYSPGAQTNRFSFGNPPTGYFSNDNFQEEEALIGYLNRYPVSAAGRPVFATYDRLNENALPYGDATPNRQGLILGFDADIEAWLHPRAKLMTGFKETTANYVLNGAGTGGVAVDTLDSVGAERTFEGWEGAMTVELAKPLELKGKTYQLGFDYKDETTTLFGSSKFDVTTLIASADFTVPFAGFDSVVLSTAFVQTQAAGSEYTLAGAGNPPTLANYSFYLDTGSLGQYSYTPLNLTRTTLAFGFLYPLSKTINFRGDLFINEYSWKDVPSYDRTDQIMRFTYEAHF